MIFNSKSLSLFVPHSKFPMMPVVGISDGSSFFPVLCRICNKAAARRKFAYFVALLARLLYRVQWDDFALNVQVLLQKLLTSRADDLASLQARSSNPTNGAIVPATMSSTALSYACAGFPKLRWDSMAVVVYLSQGSRDALTTARHAVEALSLFHAERTQDDTDFQNQATMSRILQSYLSLHFPRYLPANGTAFEFSGRSDSRDRRSRSLSSSKFLSQSNVPLLPLVVMMRTLEQSRGRPMVQLSAQDAEAGFAAFKPAAPGTEKRQFGGTFHNPFAARGRDKKKDRLKWIVNEPVVVEVVIYNPLAIAVFVPKVTLCAARGTGFATVQSIPAATLLHPRYVSVLRTHVIPTSAGILQFTHAVLQIFGMVYQFPLQPLPPGELLQQTSSLQRSSLALPAGVTVGLGGGKVPSVDVFEPQPAVHLTLHNKLGRALEGSTALILGEVRHTRFEVHNVGPVPITTFSLTAVVQIYHQPVGRGDGYTTSHSFPVMLWNRGTIQVRA